MFSDQFNVFSSGGGIEVKFDGLSIQIPEERRSLTAIRSYLESFALKQQRVLYAMVVDDAQLNLAQPMPATNGFSCIEAETTTLNELPLKLIQAAAQQNFTAQERVQNAVSLVIINEIETARELWWKLVPDLKAPLLTLSLLPENICGPENGNASLMQLRKWQLQQLAGVIQDVDGICESDDTAALAELLEKRVLPWLEKLQETINLWHNTVLAETGRLCLAATAQ